MTADKTLIDTMARALNPEAWAAWDYNCQREGGVKEPKFVHPSDRYAIHKSRLDAMNVLRSLLEAGPKGAMLRAIQSYAESQTDMDDDDGPDEAKCLAWDIAQGMNAALRAALEEAADNARLASENTELRLQCLADFGQRYQPETYAAAKDGE